VSVTAGTRFGFYEVLSPIGSGGMGEVYLAYDVRLGRRAALKVLPPRYTADQERVRRFQQEARAASALNHPNIITIFEIGQSNDTHFIAAEFVEGQNAARRLATRGLKISEALDIAIQTGNAIAAAHVAGIIHRDIKCENIMIRPDGYVKVLDFGLAKLTETFSSGGAEAEAPTQPLNETSPGMIMGTVNYMSPEQARGFRVDARSDIFSLGVVLYELLTGKLPFTGTSGSDVIAGILTQEAPPLSRYINNATPELEWIVAKALAKEKDHRFQRAEEFVTALKRAKQQIDFREEKERSDQDTVVGTESLGSGSGHAARTSVHRRRSYDTNRGFEASNSTVVTRFSGILSRPRSWALLAIPLLVLAIVAGYYLWSSRQIRSMGSIAILPFTPASNSAEASLLADSMTQGLITNLSKLPKVRVKSLASVLRYRQGSGSPADPRQVGRELDVPVILSGRVGESPNGLTINLELIDTHDNSFLWGKQYDRKRADLLALQEEITREVSRHLELGLNAKETAQFEAFQSYLRGRYFLGKRTADDLQQAIENFNKAISLDASFAPAYAGLADSYNLLGTYGSLPPNEAFPKAREAAEQALRMDDSLAEAHTALAYVKHRYEWDWTGAENEFKRAIELDPNYAPAHQWYASFLVAMGRTGNAISEAKRSQELDQFSLIVNSHLAYILYLSGRYDEALAECRKIIAIDPNFFAGLRYAGLVYEQMRRYDEAIIALERASDLSRGSQIIIGALAHAHAMAGHKDEARRLLNELVTVAPPRRPSSYEVALVHAGLGQKEEAFVWLGKAFTEKNEYLNYLLVDPRFENLHRDPRFNELVRQIGLVPRR
jgi:serine/threonine-protein kinase